MNTTNELMNEYIIIVVIAEPIAKHNQTGGYHETTKQPRTYATPEPATVDEDACRKLPTDFETGMLLELESGNRNRSTVDSAHVSDLA